MVLCRISYTRNQVGMTLFQKYEVFYSKTKRCLRICIKKVACRYYMQLSPVAYKEQKGKPKNGDNKKTKYAKFSENRKFLNP